MMMMECNGMVMIGMGVVWILTVAALVLGVAAMIKYLRSGPR